MALKERLRRQLVSARQLSERLLQDFKTPEQWTHQVYPGANHALWFAGHMAQTDNFLISLVSPERRKDREEYLTKFGVGSQPVNDPQAYPRVDEVLGYMRERRSTLLEILDLMSEEDLARPTPEGAPEFLSDYAGVFEMAIWHEGLHSGQLSVCRRALGHSPVTGGQAS